jgi:hypothetical protein
MLCLPMVNDSSGKHCWGCAAVVLSDLRSVLKGVSNRHELSLPHFRIKEPICLQTPCALPPKQLRHN